MEKFVCQVSRLEIKAGWEIAAILEQGLNSDLPGEVKALLTENVYDTATSRCLLIPQGSRLVGRYDSHISYGQDGVQVDWSRIIYPDASSVDLDGCQTSTRVATLDFAQTWIITIGH
jgi:type IV secretion system protein VirB10